MAVDHERFLEEDYEQFSEIPGFPYLRLSSTLVAGSVGEELDAAAEYLLFVMHGRKGKLLVVSNQRLVVYKIPRRKSLLRRTAGFAFSFVPLGPIGDAADLVGEVVDKSKSVGRGLKTAKDWVSSSERKKKAQNIADGMPNRKDKLDVVWDLRKPDGLALVVSYRDRILLENAFGWKVKSEISWSHDDFPLAEIRVKHDEVEFTVGATKRKRFGFASLETEYGLREIANLLADQNLDVIQTRGWSVELADEFALLYGDVDSN